MTQLCLFDEEEAPLPVPPVLPPFRYPGVSSIPGRVIMGMPAPPSVGYPSVSSFDPVRVIMLPPG